MGKLLLAALFLSTVTAWADAANCGDDFGGIPEEQMRVTLKDTLAEAIAGDPDEAPGAFEDFLCVLDSYNSKIVLLKPRPEPVQKTIEEMEGMLEGLESKLAQLPSGTPEEKDDRDKTAKSAAAAKLRVQAMMIFIGRTQPTADESTRLKVKPEF
jgi:hypothetical protein